MKKKKKFEVSISRTIEQRIVTTVECEGTTDDAEKIVSDTWIGWDKVDSGDVVESIGSTRIVGYRTG